MPSELVAILDENGNTVVSYGYDAWGAPLWCTGELAETLGKVQPFRYRGYVFDEETGLYYLRSRYYNAQWGRFVNADNVLNICATSNCNRVPNAFAYCSNGVIQRTDTDGKLWDLIFDIVSFVGSVVDVIENPTDPWAWASLTGGAAVDARTFQTEALKIEKLLYHISYAMLRNESDCEDAVQEALLRAWQKRGTLRDMAAFRSWLCRIVANTCTELLRRKQRTTLTDIPEEMPAPQSDAIDHMAVMDALAELTPQMRACMTLHYLDGWRVPEIAQMLDIPEGTVKTRLMHARKRMETLLREVET